MFLCAAAHAQKIEIDSIPTNYQQVITLDSIYRKSNLHSNAKLYFVHAYKSAKDVIQFDEPDKVIGKGFFSVNETDFLCPWRWDVYYTTEIAVKDGKYRYTISDIIIQEYAGTNYLHQGDFSLPQIYAEMKRFGRKKITTKLYNDASANFKAQIAILKEEMRQKSSLENKSDF